MSAKTRPLCTIIARNISVHNTKQTTVESVSDRDSYYQKIGNKGLDSHDDFKPEGWDNAKPFREIPGPKAWPIIGNFWRFLPGGEFYNLQMMDVHERLRKQHGNLAYLNGMPGKDPVLFAYDPDDIEMVHRNEGPWPVRYGLPSFDYYRNHVRQDAYQGVGGALTAQGEEWFKFRSVVNKILMQPRTAEMYVDSMDDVANGFIDNIKRLSKKSSKNEMPDDFQNEIYKWTLESMGVIAFNKRIGCLDLNIQSDSTGQKLIESSVQLFELMYKLDVLPSLWKIMSTRNWRKYVQVLDFFTEINMKYVNECMAIANTDPNIPDYEKSVLERLAKTDKKIAFAMAGDMIIAGIDTTGRTMAGALYFLARHPEVQEKLRQELKSRMPSKDSPVTKDIVRELLYLKAVIKETTRLSPISIGSMRRTVKNMVLSGYQIPKGTDVLSVTLLLCMQEEHFPKPKEFIPERWLRTTQGELSHKNLHQFVFLPFGFGPRSCIGRRLANLELEVGISKVIRNFKLSWNYPEAKFGMQLLYGIQDPLKIKVEELED